MLSSWRFRRALRHQAKNCMVLSPRKQNDGEKTMSSITCDPMGFCAFPSPSKHLGQLCALIIAQAKSDGASRVQFYYGKNRMVYTVQGIDYEMVPPPAPVNVDLVRALAPASGMTREKRGTLAVRFADCRSTMFVSHDESIDDPCIEVSGFLD